METTVAFILTYLNIDTSDTVGPPRKNGICSMQKTNG